MTAGVHTEGFAAGDALRGVCALCVVTTHIVDGGMTEAGGTDNSSLAHLVQVIHGLGLWSVFVFFALSGYLLGRPFVRAATGVARPPSLSGYVRNRALRILPVYGLTLLATFAMYGRSGSTWSEIATHALFGQVYDPSPFSVNAPHTWTLDVEVVFYVLLPMVFLLPARRARARTIVAVLVAVAVASVGWRGEASALELFQPPAVAFAFAAGMLVAALEPLARARLRVEAAYALAAVVPAGVAAWVLGDHGSVLASAAACAACGAAVAAPLVLQWTRGGTWPALVNPVSRWVGQRSYSLYMWHVPVMLVVGGVAPDVASPAVAVIALGLPKLVASLVIADVSYRLVELPCLRLRARWR